MYQLLIYLLSPLIVLITASQALKSQGGWRYFKQRLGFGYQSTASHNQETVWIHCASVGEVNAAEPLINHFITQAEDYRLVVTTNTPTGAQFLESRFEQPIEHYYCPLDWGFAIQSFLQATQPQKLWVMETEIWPNLFRISHNNGVAISILNGRLSKKTLTAPQWLQNTYKKTLTCVGQVIARSDDEAERFIKLGADQNKVTVLGNLKYAHLGQVKHHSNPINRDFVVAASTHEDEELKVAELWQLLNRKELLVIVPRHPKRMHSIKKQLNTLNMNLAIASLNQQPDSQTDIFLVDQIGKLMPLFEHAQLVIMGGSFVAKGGQNILEPAAYGKAILTGPDMSDFETEMQLLLNEQAIKQCVNYDDLKQQITYLLDNPSHSQTMGKKAKEIVLKESGVLDRYLQIL